ncbi:hypothetical protein [Vreelandella alkaliphila]|uniref:Uncharacterized protein n=1 Tax=Vreelandella alkaliphila TaxID=272774 RepID=A0AAJ2RZU8_9GAMM|nr:hypothetical protein [Halomonas alkaliphila]MDX5979594.1 hypothetical protein [Halomonas alkaliphila]
MTYEQWRTSYQDSEQAARAAFAMAVEHLNSRGFLALELVEKDEAIQMARSVLQMAEEPDLENPDPEDLANLNAAISEALGLLDKAVLISASKAAPAAKPASKGMDHDYAKKKLATLLRDVGNFNGDEFWREMSRLASGATGRDHAEALEKQLNRYKQAEMTWEQTMMRLLGVDGVKDAEREIAALQSRVSIVGRNMRRVAELAKAQQEWIDAVPDSVELPTMPGYSRDWADNVVVDASASLPLSDHPDFYRHKQVQDRFITQLREANRQRQAQIEQLTAQLLTARNVHYDAYWNNDDRVHAMESALDSPPLITLLASRDEENFRKGFWHGFERARMRPDEHNILNEWEEVRALRGFAEATS